MTTRRGGNDGRASGASLNPPGDILPSDGDNLPSAPIKPAFRLGMRPADDEGDFAVAGESLTGSPSPSALLLVSNLGSSFGDGGGFEPRLIGGAGEWQDIGETARTLLCDIEGPANPFDT